MRNNVAANFADRAALNLSSTDREEILQSLNIFYHEALTAIAQSDETPETFFGLSASAVVGNHRQDEQAMPSEGHLIDDRAHLENRSDEEIAAADHLQNMQGFFETAADVIADRNRQNQEHGGAVFDRAARIEAMAESLKTRLALGESVQDIIDSYNVRKIRFIVTPHPTKHMSREGEALYKKMIETAQSVAPEDRPAALREVMKDMLRTPLTPRRKDSLEDETFDGFERQAVFLEGMLDFTEDLQQAFGKALGPGAANVMDTTMDMAPRSWFGTDNDGKRVPAPFIFVQRMLAARRAVKSNMGILSDQNVPEAGREKLAEILDVFHQMDGVFDNLCAPERVSFIRALTSTSHKFQQVKDEYRAVFKDVQYKGATYGSQEKLMKAVMDDLRDIIDGGDPETARVARRVALRYQSVGLAMGRQQFRHDSREYIEIFDNLFAWLEKNEPDVMRKLIPSGKAFGDLTPQTQAAFLKNLQSAGGEKLRDWLMASNERGYHPDGSGGWPGELLEQFKMIGETFNQERMGEMISANATPISSVMQQVLAEAFGIKNAVHMDLNEEEETVEKTVEKLKIYQQYFGQKNLKNRGGNAVEIMSAHSDTQKSKGPLVKFLQKRAEWRNLNLSLEFNQAVLEQYGAGMSYARGGMSPIARIRLFMSLVLKREKIKGELSDEQRALVKQEAAFVAITIQGRDPGIRFATPAQVYDMFMNIQDEISASHLAIDKRIDPDLYVKPDMVYSQPMRNAMKKITQGCFNKYNLMRTEDSRKSSTLGEDRLESYVNEVAPMKLLAFMNAGNRASQRPGEKTLFKNARAINSNMTFVGTETFADGSYTLGHMLKSLHEEYKKGHIGKEDLTNLWEDPFFKEFMLTNSFVALAHADYEYGFDKLDAEGSKGWTVGRLRASAAQKYKDIARNDNLAFHAVLAQDALEFTAFYEALGNTVEGREGAGFDASYDDIMKARYNDDDRLSQLKFGPLTMERFPEIENSRELARKTRFSRVALHEMERRIQDKTLDPKDPKNAAMLFHVALANRSYGPYNMPKLLDQNDFGSRKKPIFKLIREYMLAKNLKRIPAVENGSEAHIG